MSSNLTFNRLKKEMQDPRLEDGIPGYFSPRPSHSRSFSTVSNALDTETPSKLAEALCVSIDLAEGSEQYASSRAAGTFSALHVQSSPPERVSQSRASLTLSQANNASVHEERLPCRSPPMVTLTEHQRARSSSASFLHEYGVVARVSEKSDIMISSTQAGAMVSEPFCTDLRVCEAYISGKPWSYIAENQNGIYRNPSSTISALATSSSGEYVAIGDRSGCLLVMLRTHSEQRNDLCGLESEEHETGNDEEGKGAWWVSKPYKFIVGRQAYTSVIDPLNSVEVTPNIQALCFLPRVGLTTYLLAANEKMPKLYKVMQVRESPAPFVAVEHLGERETRSLTVNPLCGRKTTAMKQVSRYALNHEYKINALCPLADSAHFFSADDLSVKLWCVDYPDTSIETYALKSPFEDDMQETICNVKCFPHEPHLLFVLTTSGVIRVFDARQTLKWIQQTPLVFRNTLEGDDSLFRGLSDCALSPCGRCIAGRDMAGVCLWDIRQPAVHKEDTHLHSSFSSPSIMNRDEHRVVQRWRLHQHCRQDIEQHLQREAMERFCVQFLNNHEICTGGFNRMLYLMDTMKDDSAFDHQQNGTALAAGGRVRPLQLPQLSDTSNMAWGSLHSFEMEDMPSLFNDSELQIGTAVTQLSSPLTSSNGDCCMLASCGQTLFQLTYSNLRH